MGYEEAMDVLRAWAGRTVWVVAFVEPGVSLLPFAGTLSCVEAGRRTLRASIAPADGEPLRIAFPAGTFHEASWVPGREGTGLSVTQGATRIDVFAE